jgi:hypothetical protein
LTEKFYIDNNNKIVKNDAQFNNKDNIQFNDIIKEEIHSNNNKNNIYHNNNKIIKNVKK